MPDEQHASWRRVGGTFSGLGGAGIVAAAIALGGPVWALVGGTALLLAGVYLVAAPGTRFWPRSRATQDRERHAAPSAEPASEAQASSPEMSRPRSVITPQKLWGFFQGHTDMQAERLVAPFIGQVIDVSGFVERVFPWDGTMAYVFIRPGDTAYPQILLSFSDESSLPSLAALAEGELIRASGKIHKVGRNDVLLVECSLIFDA